MTKASCKTGFTLVETLVTVMILSVGIVTVIGALMTGQKACVSIERYDKLLTAGQAALPVLVSQPSDMVSDFDLDISEGTKCQTMLKKSSEAQDLAEAGLSTIDVRITCPEKTKSTSLTLSTILPKQGS